MTHHRLLEFLHSFCLNVFLSTFWIICLVAQHKCLRDRRRTTKRSTIIISDDTGTLASNEHQRALCSGPPKKNEMKVRRSAV